MQETTQIALLAGGTRNAITFNALCMSDILRKIKPAKLPLNLIPSI